MWQALAFDITVLLLIDKALELNVLTEEILNRKVKGKGLAVVLTSRGVREPGRNNTGDKRDRLRGRWRNEKV